MKLFIIALSAVLAVMPQAFGKSVEVPSDLKGLQRSAEDNAFTPYPVFVSVNGRTLNLRYRGHSGQSVRELNVMFTKKKTGDAIAAIDKFLEWERLATERGDTFVKAIADVGTVSGTNVRMTFRSLDSGRHALEMGVRSKLLGNGSGAAAGVVDLLIDSENATKLRELLVRFHAGKPLIDGSVYN